MITRLGLCLAAAISCAHADNIETVVERSQNSAREVLNRAVDAIGGEDELRSIRSVRLHLEGDTWPRMQMPTPEPPFEGGTMREDLLIDFTTNRLRLEQRVIGAGFQNHNTVAIVSGEGMSYDHWARTVMPIPAAQSNQQQFIQYYRRLPNLILRQALDRTSSLRSLGRGDFDGRQHDVFTFVMADTQQVAVYVDGATNLVSKYELLTVDPLTGDDASEIVFGDYKSVGKLRLPHSWEQRLAGDVISKFRLQAEINPSVSAESFAALSGAFTKVAPLPDVLKEDVEQLADSVFVFHNIAEQNYNVLAIAMRDHIVVVEAPATSEGSDRVIKSIKEKIPGKPIRYVALTHHHSDHLGGLRSFIAEGATVITVESNRRLIEAIAAAPLPDRLGKAPREVKFLFVDQGKRVLTDGAQTIELIDVGPNPHSKQMLVAYLPKHRVIFQGDLFFKPANDAPPGPPQTATASFAKRLKELKLEVDRIASVHGRTASIAEFDAALKDTT